MPTKSLPRPPPDDDDDDGVEQAIDQQAEAMPTSEELCELSGEDTLSQIREVVLRERGLLDVGALLAPLERLEVLSLSNNSIQSLASWPRLPELTVLNINFNRVSSLEPLAACTRLSKLYAASNRVGTITPLGACTELRALSLFRNRIGSLESTLECLSALPRLEELDLGANPCAIGPAYRHQLVGYLPALERLDGDTLTDLDHDIASAYLNGDGVSLNGEGDIHLNGPSQMFGWRATESISEAEAGDAASCAPTHRAGLNSGQSLPSSGAGSGAGGSAGGGAKGANGGVRDGGRGGGADVLVINNGEGGEDGSGSEALYGIGALGRGYEGSSSDDDAGAAPGGGAVAAAMAAAAAAADMEEAEVGDIHGTAGRLGSHTGLGSSGGARLGSGGGARLGSSGGLGSGRCPTGTGGVTGASRTGSRPGTALLHPNSSLHHPSQPQSGGRDREQGIGSSMRPRTGSWSAGRPGTGHRTATGRPGSAHRPGTGVLRPGSSLAERPGTSSDGRPGTASGRPGTASVRATGLFKDPWLNSNPILLEYLTKAELEKHDNASCGGSHVDGGSGGAASAPLDELPDGASYSLPDGSAVGVVSLRRPLVERLRLTAAAMEKAASAGVDALASSSLFDGVVSDEEPASRELRQLLVALQDMTAEKDEAVAALQKEQAIAAAAASEHGEAAVFVRLREENVRLATENANMFTLMEENASLRTEVETLRLQLQCQQIEGAQGDEK